MTEDTQKKLDMEIQKFQAIEKRYQGAITNHKDCLKEVERQKIANQLLLQEKTQWDNSKLQQQIVVQTLINNHNGLEQELGTEINRLKSVILELQLEIEDNKGSD